MHTGGKYLGKVHCKVLLRLQPVGFKRVRWCWHLVENASCNGTLLVGGCIKVEVLGGGLVGGRLVEQSGRRAG